MLNLYNFLIAKKVAENKGVDSTKANRLALLPAALGGPVTTGVALVASEARSEVKENEVKKMAKLNAEAIQQRDVFKEIADSALKDRPVDDVQAKVTGALHRLGYTNVKLVNIQGQDVVGTDVISALSEIKRIDDRNLHLVLNLAGG